MSTKKNILLVDDDEITNFLNERVIHSTGLINGVLKAHNGREALNLLNQHEDDAPDVILLDLNMPIMNGFEFLQAFQNLELDNKEQMLIIVATSSYNPTDIERAKSLGIKHYVTKPISAENIRSIILQEFE